MAIRVLLLLICALTVQSVTAKDIELTPAAIHEAAHFVYTLEAGNHHSLIHSIRVKSRLEGKNLIKKGQVVKLISVVFMSGHYFHWLVAHSKRTLSEQEFKEFLEYYKTSGGDYDSHIKHLNLDAPSKINEEFYFAKSFIEYSFDDAFPKIKKLATHLTLHKEISGADAYHIINNL